MNTLHNFSILIVIAFMSFGLNAQDINSTEYYDQDIANILLQDSTQKKVEKKIHYSLNTGFSYSYIPKYGGIFSNYIEPQISYSLTPKLSINTGLIFTNHRLPFANPENTNKTGSNFFTSTYLFTEAEYKFNQKLKIAGAILYDLNNNSPFSNKKNKVNFYYINGEYQITKNLSIGVQVSSQQRQYSPFYNTLNQW